jgi:hypothetical protein
MEPEYIYLALVKKDDFEKTKSTGGIVVDIFYVPKNYKDYPICDYITKYGSDYMLVKCNKNTKIGWIYTDKTNFLIDSAYSTNNK